MAKSKIPKDDDGGGGGSGDWLNTYADMVTLLLTFFILLYSMSSPNPIKWDQLIQTYGNREKNVSVPEDDNLVEAEPVDNEEKTSEDAADLTQLYAKLIQNPDDSESIEEMIEELKEQYAFEHGMEYELNLENIYEIMNQYIINNNLQEKVGLEKDQNFVMIRFKDKAFFDSGRAALKSDSTVIIKAVCAAINLVIDQVDEIIVEGHTDSVPQNTFTFPSNWELSTARATNVVKFFIEYDLPPTKMSAVGKAEFAPLVEEIDEETKSLNRRVEIYLTRIKLPEILSQVNTEQENADVNNNSEDVTSDIIETNSETETIAPLIDTENEAPTVTEPEW